MIKSKFISKILLFALCFMLGLSSYPLSVKANHSTKENNVNGVSALQNNITNLNLKGYVGQNLKNNVKFWQYSAYENNKNIIEQIANAQSNASSFSSVLGTDYFGVDGYYDINLVSHEGVNSMGWTLKSLPVVFSDRDIRFVNDQSAITNWSGISELWVKLDASEIPTQTFIRLAFEENSVGRESFSLKENVTVYFSTDSTTLSISSTSGGYIPIPVGFKGYLRIPFNQATYSAYWSENGNGALDCDNVVQFQMAIKGGEQMVGKTFYIDEFGIFGAVGGGALPIPVSGSNSSFSYKTVWNMQALTPKTNYSSSSLAWYGEFVGKLLTGMAFSYKATNDEDLKNVALQIIDELSRAQGEDGYLGVFIGKQRFSLGASNWDLWNHYHAVVGLLEWYNLTDSEVALEIAIKALDCIYETFKDRSYLVMGGFETNRGIAHGYAMAYQVTGDKKYLNEAQRIIMQDCQDERGWYKCALNNEPFFASSSSRWEVLHMIMTLGILYEETGNQEYFTVMERVWQSILKYDIHNGGGFTTNENATGNPYTGGVIETCCTIAWMAFTNEYYKYSKSVVAVDELERSYYNAMLGSLLEDDKYCTYNTPMDGIAGSCGGYEGRRVSSQRDIAFQYNSGSPDMNCCQANLARGLGQIAEWACLTDGNDLYLNYYGASEINTFVGGDSVTLKITSAYPVEGKVKVQISGLENNKNFALMLRIPSFAHGTSLKIGNEIKRTNPGTYYRLERTWANGDTFELDIALDITYLVGDKEKVGYTSVYYGPILLTLDKGINSNYNHNIAFLASELEKAQVSSASIRGGILDLEVKVGDSTVKLIDFASAGKSADGSAPTTYWSWIKVEGAPSQNSEDYTKQWHGTNKGKVYFGDNISFDRALFYQGEKVIFNPVVPSGYSLKQIKTRTINGSVEITYDEDTGEYSFVMPDVSVAVEVEFQKEIINEINSSSATNSPGCFSNVRPSLPLMGAVSISSAVIVNKKRQKKQI